MHACMNAVVLLSYMSESTGSMRVPGRPYYGIPADF